MGSVHSTGMGNAAEGKGQPLKYKRNVYQSFALIMQFGINMIVPVFLCTAIGIWIGRKFDNDFIVVPLFIIGSLAGMRNIFIMAKKIYQQKDGRDTKDVKKTK